MNDKRDKRHDGAAAVAFVLTVCRGLWPLPAFVGWLLCWLLYLGLRTQGMLPALGASLLLAWALSLLQPPGWRRLIVGLGYALSWLAHAAARDLPSWAWLAPLLLLWLLYPRRNWRDAPLYPTPRAALDGLPALLPLAAGSRVLDAGCGLGDGLAALHRAYPQAQLEGVEWSLVLSWICARRCRYARVSRGDLWAQSWRDLDLVYLFQRPESMGRALDKAAAELRPGASLLSLDFELPGREPVAKLPLQGRHQLFLYRF